MKTKVDKWLIRERAEAMAKMHLLRRDDLRVSETRADSGLDYAVRIVKDDGSPPRQFGVVLQGAIPAMTVQQVNKTLRTVLREASSVAFSYPVCLFYFTMQDNGSFVTWVAEPVIDSDGKPALTSHEQANCEPLNLLSLDRRIEQIELWYDAFYATVARRTEGNGMNDGLKVWYRIIDAEAEYNAAHGEPPKMLKLPLRLAYDLAKLAPEGLGDLSTRLLKEGIRALEKEPLFGMKVQLVRDLEDITVE